MIVRTSITDSSGLLPSSPYILNNGQAATLSLIGPDDRDALLDGFDGLSSTSRYFRFFSPMPKLSPRLLNNLLNTNGTGHVAIGARLVDPSGVVQSPIIGVARYFLIDADRVAAEAAVAVIDSLQGLGLGKLLLSNLSRIALCQGIIRFRLHALAENVRIHQLLQVFNGLVVEHEGPVVVYEFELQGRSKSSHCPDIVPRVFAQ